MSRARWITAATAAVAMIGGASWYAQRDSADSPVAAPLIRPMAATAREPIRSAAANTQRATPARKAALDYATRFRNAEDLLSFAEEIHEAASAGDGAAQFYMFRVFERCSREYLMYFGRDERERTLDQALILAEQIPGFSSDVARELFQKCRRFKQTNTKTLGDGPAWLDAAVKSHYPLALAVKARERSKSEFGTTPRTAAEQKATVRALAIEALKSGSADVVYELAPAVAMFAEAGDNAEDVYNTWLIAACNRGFDCGSDSEVFRVMCSMDPACQPFETFLDPLRRRLGSHFDEVERRATDLNARIDAGRFDELGL
jgi:hypothetical protein